MTIVASRRAREESGTGADAPRAPKVADLPGLGCDQSGHALGALLDSPWVEVHRPLENEALVLLFELDETLLEAGDGPARLVEARSVRRPEERRDDEKKDGEEYLSEIAEAIRFPRLRQWPVRDLETAPAGHGLSSASAARMRSR
jgi:hypothetical protein